jgi:hypothetical protein
MSGTKPLSKTFQHKYGMKNGHAPIASKVVCVDFDATLFPWGPLFNPDAKPLDGAAEAVRAFAEAGWTVVIFTSRMSRQWLASSGEKREDHIRYIRQLCRDNDIPYSRIIGEKIPAQAYIDDKAIEYDGTNWDSIRERVLSLG